MNTLLIFTVFFTAACMADVSHLVNKQPAILNSVQDLSPDGSFKYAYDTENGISANAEGGPEAETQQGSYRYTAPDGQVIHVDWTAGPLGFIAKGAAIPATPDHVLRTLEYNAAHPYKEEVQP